ncbi:MAG: AMP-binding protein [Candidatus Binatia bacterium]
MTLIDTLRRRGTDPAERERIWLRFEGERFTFGEALREVRRYARLFLRHRPEGRPFHLGILMENRPEFVFAELGIGMAGGVMVGLNPTRRGAHLARDIGFSDCALVLTEPKLAPILAEALGSPCEDPPSPARVWITTRRNASAESPSRFSSLEIDLDLLGAEAEEDPPVEVRDEDLFQILFTSGTTQAPKGVLRSHGPLAMMGAGAAWNWAQATEEDVVYTAMPLFHANAQILGLGVSLGCGCGWAIARSFHKTRFLDDVRRYGCTLFHYVGSPLAYVMDTPERPDDADNPLRFAFGNEAPRQFIDAFARRFGCRVSDSYGASEVGVVFTRQDGDPPGSLGRATPGVKILNEAGEECAVARLDADGRLQNPDEAVGEIVNTAGRGMFEGYYKNPEATEERTRGGRYYTGDLGYRDAGCFVYFAGRSREWLRVQGENFLARPIEQILSRHRDVFLVAVYAVPDPEAGDRVMAAIVPRRGTSLDLRRLARFLDGERDLSPRWKPTFVRVANELRRTETNKVLKRELQREAFLLDRVSDPIYWLERGEREYRPFTPEDLARLVEQFRRAGTASRLGL